MPIEFLCPSCQSRIRTPDGTAGKQARCPHCSAVVLVPDGATPAAAPAPVLSPAPLPSAPLPANPFSERTAPLNPYAAPNNPQLNDPFQPAGPEQIQRARANLLAPAIGLIVFAVMGLALMALVAGMAAFDPKQLMRGVGDNEAERAGAIGFFVVYFGFGFVTRVLQFLGALAMLRCRSYRLAMAGAICALVPCEVYCCLPNFPLGIWALIVLNSASVRAAFRQA